jgi:hypothetical protein
MTAVNGGASGIVVTETVKDDLYIQKVNEWSTMMVMIVYVLMVTSDLI